MGIGSWTNAHRTIKVVSEWIRIAGCRLEWLTPPALQVPTPYDRPYTYVGAPIKIAALTCPTAPAENWTAVLVYPWFGSPPPQKATSKISAP